jgi:hypothetical protein
VKPVKTKRRAWVAGALTIGALTACLTACHRAAPSDAPEKPVPSSPVPPPPGLVADAVVRGPDALWGRLQQGIAGPLAHLPSGVGGLLAATAKLDLTLAGEIDGAAPAYAAMATEERSVGWLVALKLRDLAHARAALLGGQKPRFTGRAIDGGVLVLGPPAGAPLPDPTLALSPLGYLLVASTEKELASLAPYATRTLPARPPSPHGLVVAATHAALAGAIDEHLAASLASLKSAALALDDAERKSHGNKDPDFGDPSVLVERTDNYARSKLAILGDLDHAELTLDADDDEVDVEVSLATGAGPSAKAFSGYATGNASPLLSVSGESEAAILMRDEPGTRADETKSLEESTVAVLKRALSDKDTVAVHEAFAAWAGARGPWLTVNAELGGAPALTLRSPTADEGRAMRAIGGFVDLSNRPVFHQLLAARLSVEGVSTATAASGAEGSTSIATFRRATTRPGKNGEAGEIAIAWAAAGQVLRVGVGASAARALRATKDADHLLGSDVRLAGKLGTLRDRAAMVFVLRPNLGPEAEGVRPSAVLGVGRDKSNGWSLLEVDDALLRFGLGRWLDP